MGWEDRDYYREGRSGGDPFLNILSWSLSLGHYWRVHVRLHLFFLIFIAIEMLQSAVMQGGSVALKLRWLGLLFVSVLMHEFGHVFACRAVGGRANDIVLWPLGGLAQTEPPQRPWPSLVTTACGPLVNLAIAAGAYVGFMQMSGDAPAVGLAAFFEPFPATTLRAMLFDLYAVNVLLFLFNMLLLCMPFDGGLIVQELLWFAFGWHRSMVYACRFGLVFSLLVGFTCLAFGQIGLAVTLAFGFYYCYQTLNMLPMIQEQRQYGFGGDDLWEVDKIAKKKESAFAKWRKRRAEARMEKIRRETAAAEAEVDRILAKVKAQGLQSLTEREKRTLKQDTERRNRVG